MTRRSHALTGSPAIDRMAFIHSRMGKAPQPAASLVLAGGSHRVHFVHTRKGRSFASFAAVAETAEVTALGISRDGTLLATGSSAGELAVWRIDAFCVAEPPPGLAPPSTPPPLLSRWAAHAADVTSVELLVLQGQPMVLSASRDGNVRLWQCTGAAVGACGHAWTLPPTSG